jgi:hypothetical protein
MSYRGAGADVVPVSLTALCAVAQVQLIGKPSRMRKPFLYLHTDARYGHTGELYVENDALTIRIPSDVDRTTARVSVAHELGHALIHFRDNRFDHATIKLPSTDDEEALAEYGARLLLMPREMWNGYSPESNLAEYVVKQAGTADSTLHSAVLRLGDPDLSFHDIEGAILWRLNRHIAKHAPIHERLTPYWHVCPNAFVPIKKSQARVGSLVSDIAAENGHAGTCATRTEQVQIGSFGGRFKIDAFASGSVSDGTRFVLSIFRKPPGR